MRNHTIPLYLPEPQSSVPVSFFYRLMDEDLDGATGTGVDFIIYHVFERFPGRFGRLEVFGVAVVHYFEATGLIAVFAQQGGDYVDYGGITKNTVSPCNQKRWVKGFCGFVGGGDSYLNGIASPSCPERAEILDN